ncbi:MAG TPA: hypothetical protein VM621_01115 [Luteibacter sp.]|uniref:hypothetical protein n=1 Tax=Luteibacter sp. TaxID=1886636 RepID=UPI002D008A48|nr:hypothetical protein [Luteibacter sp.]HVI53632.1 hypothetical protein [Luteibacter sp.]
MQASTRKKSPRSPSVALDEALERALRAYDRDRLHAAPTEVFAQNVGYKGANNGAALGVLASLRYYGLAERPSEGMLALTKAVEDYRFAPEEHMRQSLLKTFLRSPPLYDELLSKYATGLPSDANLRYELIQRGFSPSGAESALTAFKRSVEFAGYFDHERERDAAMAQMNQLAGWPESNAAAQFQPVTGGRGDDLAAPTRDADTPSAEENDRIPVRLPGGRRAWLIIPSPFYEADKSRLKAQIDLLLTEEDGA